MKSYRSFTLIELVLSIGLLLSIYSIFTTTFNFQQIKQEHDVTLINIKEYLTQNYSFLDKLELVCIEDGKTCYVLIDQIISKEHKINNLFDEKPQVYTYDYKQELLEYTPLEFDNFETFEVCFKLSFDYDNKSNEMVIVTDDKVYAFNAIKDTPILFNTLNEVVEQFDKNKQEVKYAL